MSESTGIIESDAPVDNTAYGRENGEWVATFAAVEMNLFVQQVNTNAQVARSAELAAKDAAIAANDAVNLVQQDTQNAQIARNAAEAAASNAARSQQQANADALATQNALLATQQIKTDVQTLSSLAADQLDSIATEGAKQIAQAKSHADKAALSEQASSESATRSESAAKRTEELVDQATSAAFTATEALEQARVILADPARITDAPADGHRYARVNREWVKLPEPYKLIKEQPSDMWFCPHNLGKIPRVSVFSLGGVQVEAEIEHPTENMTVVKFTVPFAGYVICEI